MAHGPWTRLLEYGSNSDRVILWLRLGGLHVIPHVTVTFCGIVVTQLWVWFWIGVNWIKGECWVLVEVCTLLSALVVKFSSALHRIPVLPYHNSTSSVELLSGSVTAFSVAAPEPGIGCHQNWRRRRAWSKLSRDASKLFYLILLLLLRRDNVMRHRSVCRGRTKSPCCNCKL